MLFLTLICIVTLGYKLLKVKDIIIYLSQTYLHTYWNSTLKKDKLITFNEHNNVRIAETKLQLPSENLYATKITISLFWVKLKLFKSIQWKTNPLWAEKKEHEATAVAKKKVIVWYKSLTHGHEKSPLEIGCCILKYIKIFFERNCRNWNYRVLIWSVSMTNKTWDKCFSCSLCLPLYHLQQRLKCHKYEPKNAM